MKSIKILSFLFLLTGYSHAQYLPSTKYIKFWEKDKVGLCDHNGKIIIPAEFDRIQSATDEIFVSGGKEKSEIRSIPGNNVLHSFQGRSIDTDVTPKGFLLVQDSLGLYFFDKNGKQKGTLSFNGSLPEFERFPACVTVKLPVKNDSLKATLIFIDNQLEETARYSVSTKESPKKRRYEKAPFFEINVLSDGNKNTVSRIVADSVGRKLFEVKNAGSDWSEEWFETINGKTYEVDYDSKVNQIVSKKLKPDDLKNTFFIREEKEGDLRIPIHYTAGGDLIKRYPPGSEFDDVSSNKTDEVFYFVWKINDSTRFVTDPQLNFMGDMQPWHTTDTTADYWEYPDDDQGFLLLAANKKYTLHNLLKKKPVLEFTPNEKNVFESKGLMPVSEVFNGSHYAYKNGSEFGYMDMFSEKKTRLFDFSPPNGMSLLSVNVKSSNQYPLLEFKIEFGNTETEGDTTISFLIKSNKTYQRLTQPKIHHPRILRAFTEASYDSYYLSAPFLAVSHSGHDSLILIDNKGKYAVKEKGGVLYCVSENYYGVSDGKTSTLFTRELKPVEKKMQGVVCAVLESGEKIILDNGKYFLKKGKKSNLLFTQNKLMGWSEDHVNSIDSGDYVAPHVINHAERRGDHLLFYVCMPEDVAFRLALYNEKTKELSVCLKQQYADVMLDTELPETFIEHRFKLIKQLFDSADCFASKLDPQFLLDTLEVSSDFLEFGRVLKNQFPDHITLYSKDQKRGYFGTPEKLSFSFPQLHISAEEWDCGIRYFGNIDQEFYLVDGNGKFSSDRYSAVNGDLEASCENDLFMAKNVSNGGADLFKNDGVTYTKIYSGKFENFSMKTTAPDALGRNTIVYLFYDKNQSEYVTDAQFKPLFDSAQYKIVAEFDKYNAFDYGGNYLVLEGKKDSSIHFFNIITKKMVSVPSADFSEETYRGLRLVFFNHANNPDIQDIIVAETGETLRNYSMAKSEYFMSGNKLLLQKYEDNGEIHVYTAEGKLIR